jgi:S-adenosylmethionine decarboxylase proenzyme
MKKLVLSFLLFCNMFAMTPEPTPANSPAPVVLKRSPSIYDFRDSDDPILMNHLVCDFITCVIPDDAITIEAIMREAARLAGANSLEFIFHHFEPDGISAMLILAESHISLHYWFEQRYAAIDVFTCGKCEPHKAVAYLEKMFGPIYITINRVERPGL